MRKLIERFKAWWRKKLKEREEKRLQAQERARIEALCRCCKKRPKVQTYSYHGPKIYHFCRNCSDADFDQKRESEHVDRKEKEEAERQRLAAVRQDKVDIIRDGILAARVEEKDKEE